MKIQIILIFLFSLLKIIITNYNNVYLIHLNNDETDEHDFTKETSPVSNRIDMGPCTCMLYEDHCNYRCCCDTNCPEEKRKIWKENNLCLNKNTYHLSDYTCHSVKHEKNDSYNWNKYNSPFLFKDQISKLICVRYDRVKNKIGEYYIIPENSALNNHLQDSYNYIKENSYLKNLEKQRLRTLQNSNNTFYYYNEKFLFRIYNESEKETFCIKKLSSYGIPLFEHSFNFLIPAEGYFEIKKESECEIGNKNEIKKMDHTINCQSVDSFVKQLTINIIYKTNPNNATNYSKIDNNEVIPKCPSFPNKIFISINWSNNDSDINSQNNIISGNPGYLVGKNVLFLFNDSEIYTNGLSIYGADESNNCIVEDSNFNEKDITNYQPIKFKVNSIYSCKIRDLSECDINEYLIFKSIEENFKGTKIGKFGNSYDSDTDWIPIQYESFEQENLMDFCNIPKKIFLEILVTKFSTKGKPQEMIVGAKIKYSNDFIKKEHTFPVEIQFITKFITISEELFNKEDKLTSLYSITDPSIKEP